MSRLSVVWYDNSYREERTKAIFVSVYMFVAYIQKTLQNFSGLEQNLIVL